MALFSVNVMVSALLSFFIAEGETDSKGVMGIWKGV